MKTKLALKIAEHIWNDTVRPGSMYDAMMQTGPELLKLKEEGKMDEVNQQVENMKVEIVARWANIIQEIGKEE
jgi:hypothetical protein